MPTRSVSCSLAAAHVYVQVLKIKLDKVAIICVGVLAQRAEEVLRGDHLPLVPYVIVAQEVEEVLVTDPLPQPAHEARRLPVRVHRSEEHTSELQSRPHLVCR